MTTTLMFLLILAGADPAPSTAHPPAPAADPEGTATPAPAPPAAPVKNRKCKKARSQAVKTCEKKGEKSKECADKTQEAEQCS